MCIALVCEDSRRSVTKCTNISEANVKGHLVNPTLSTRHNHVSNGFLADERYGVSSSMSRNLCNQLSAIDPSNAVDKVVQDCGVCTRDRATNRSTVLWLGLRISYLSASKHVSIGLSIAVKRDELFLNALIVGLILFGIFPKLLRVRHRRPHQRAHVTTS